MAFIFHNNYMGSFPLTCFSLFFMFLFYVILNMSTYVDLRIKTFRDTLRNFRSQASWEICLALAPRHSEFLEAPQNGYTYIYIYIYIYIYRSIIYIYMI
jgi:hypothetical protein